MIKNGKFFVAPQHDGGDFKAVFKRLATAGAGRPVDKDGFAEGPWTPDLLADAISRLDGNEKGVDLRTVQLWFQDNEKGPNPDNIRWLARVFGCDDQVATSGWQSVLSAAQSELIAKRRAKRRQSGNGSAATVDPAPPVSADDRTEPAVEQPIASIPKRRRSLAMRSEAIFSRGSPLDLPSTVFAGAVALGFLSYLTGIHNVLYERVDGLIKQVGFIWAPNWTFLFMVFLPLFFAFVVDLVVFWKNEGRPKFFPERDRAISRMEWERQVETSSYTYWAVFLICLAFAGLFQWIGVRLIPLLRGGGDYAIDWGSLAIVRPEVISVPEAIGFTGFAYLYMCLCFYLFFVGLILLYTVAFDLWQVGEDSKLRPDLDFSQDFNEMGLRVMRGIFRCTICGVLVAVCMKLQSFYLSSSGTSIVGWLLNDMTFAVYGHHELSDEFNYSMPTHYTSLLVALATCAPFLYGSIRLGVGSRFQVPLGIMAAVIVLLVVSYLMIGAFPGFAILLSVGVLVSIYGLFDPGFGSRRSSHLGGNKSVS
ncbi:RcgA family putative transporter [Phaeobacter piscinae]|uniref:RcgA family putative transporter n=1 Tax=Phaeobacter piscinae TaxID=1580596 RepID=UPI000590353F|nr:hypothetical protein [Phaeobacter piscinae]